MATYSVNENKLFEGGVAILQAANNHETFVVKDLCNYLNGSPFQGQKLVVSDKEKVIWSNGRIIMFIIGNINTIKLQLKIYSENSNLQSTNGTYLKSSKKQILKLDNGKPVILKR